jgi:hypothetical protein
MKLNFWIYVFGAIYSGWLFFNDGQPMYFGIFIFSCLLIGATIGVKIRNNKRND